MSMSAREAAEGLRDLSQTFKKVIRAGELLEGIANIEQVTTEASLAADQARAAKVKAEAELHQVHDRISESEARFTAAQARIQAAQEAAQLEAQQTVARGDIEAQAIVAEAQAKADAIAATLREAQADAKAAVQEAVAKRSELEGLAEQVRILRATAAKIAG